MIQIPRLEIHASHKCNLHCEQCSNFSDYYFNQDVSLEEIETSYKTWSNRIHPNCFGIMGGEPLMNKDILEVIRLTRKYWNKSSIDITTNGLLLYRFPELPKVLKENNVTLQISTHYTENSTEKYHKKFTIGFELAKKWVYEYGIDLNIVGNNNFPVMKFFHQNNKVNLITQEPYKWYKIYQGFGKNIKPLQSERNPKKSWDLCGAKYCVQLYQNKIYKCPAVAYTRMIKEKFGEVEPELEIMIKYSPLSPDASQQEVAEFFNRKEEEQCAMCPTEFETFDPTHDPMKYRYRNIDIDTDLR